MKRAQAFMALAFIAAHAFAADYPTKLIRIVSPFPPGGSVGSINGGRSMGSDSIDPHGSQ